MKLSLPPKLMVLGPNFTLQITLISTILNDLEFPLPKLLKSINGSKEWVVTNHVQAHNKVRVTMYIDPMMCSNRSKKPTQWMILFCFLTILINTSKRTLNDFVSFPHYTHMKHFVYLLVLNKNSLPIAPQAHITTCTIVTHLNDD